MNEQEFEKFSRAQEYAKTVMEIRSELVKAQAAGDTLQQLQLMSRYLQVTKEIAAQTKSVGAEKSVDEAWEKNLP